MPEQQLEKNPVYQKSMQEFQKAFEKGGLELVSKTYDDLRERTKENQRKFVDKALQHFFSSIPWEKIRDAELKNLQETHNQKMTQFNEFAINTYYSANVSSEVSKMLMFAAGATDHTSQTFDLANKYVQFVEKGISQVAVYDYDIQNALNKGDLDRAKELMKKRDAYVLSFKDSLMDKQRELSSNLKEDLTNYIKEFYEREKGLAGVELAAGLIPFVAGAKNILKIPKAIKEAKFAVEATEEWKSVFKKVREKAVEYLTSNEAKTVFKGTKITINTIKSELKNEAKQAADKIMKVATDIKKTALEHAEGVIPVYGSFKELSDLSKAQEDAERRARDALDLLFNPQTKVALGGNE